MQAETLKEPMNYSRGVQRGGRVAVEVGRVVKEVDGTQKSRQLEGGVAGSRENDIVIHPTLCHKLRLKDAKLQAHSLPWVRYCSSNKVNNCFTVMHTLVLLEAKLPSCCIWFCGTLCRQGRV